MTAIQRLIMVLAIISCWGCSPPVPELPATIGFPAGTGRIEVRKKLGDVVGGIGDRHNRIHTSIVYVKEDGGDVVLPLHTPSFHKGRALATVALRGDGKSYWRDVTGPQQVDVYVDSKAVDREEFDEIAKSFRDNLEAIQVAYLNMLDSYDEEPVLMSLNYYDVSMFRERKYYWSQNTGVYFQQHPTGANVFFRVPLRERGPAVIWIGQILVDGQHLLMCDLTHLDQHPNYSLSFEKAFKGADLKNMIEECTDIHGNRLSDLFAITYIPVREFENRAKLESQKFTAPASK
ncbi:hypothetical protein CA54_54000 [Symmachiella macrocystis]|uniref:Uncharacterized protein n=1 Tax=Symmachiella macrocystis TaxID=2527985 RepID=A0A5C6B6U2_9PLAN|nr:hypothetical protein [Symmachiella macrocystis]TWU06996.1 hypothetical protein CA54_54000 [Symmachiella macrocystis]